MEKLIYESGKFMEKHGAKTVFFFLALISALAFIYFYTQNLTLTYNDARSHLDIGRRVVEGLKPGLAQLGSVWLPLPHFLMIITIWNDFMWHTGLAGAVNSMVSYVLLGLYIWFILKKIGVSPLNRLLGVLIFALNTNILYLQSTAMTEVLLLLTLTAATYELINWAATLEKYNLIKAAFWTMLSTLIRYEGWFLFLVAAIMVYLITLKKLGKKIAEGTLILYSTLGGFGILMWFAWNKLIFGDYLYFAYGPYSAHAQQDQLAAAGDLPTKGNLIYSTHIYGLALYYCIGLILLVSTLLGAALLFFDPQVKRRVKFASVVLLLSPVIFNVVALYLGHSVLFIQGINGKSWFNVRYGVMIIPAAAVFGAYLADKSRLTFFKIAVFLTILASCIAPLFNVKNSVTVADALYGSSGKDVSQVAGWLKSNVGKNDHVLISAASHDAVIFSSGLEMSQFIHEGTGPFWDAATTNPDHWAKFIVMRTNDVNDSTFKLLKDNQAALSRYNLAYKGYFADIYKLKDSYDAGLTKDYTLNAFANQKVKDLKISSLLSF